MNMKSYEGQTFMTQVISKRVYALVAGPRTPKKKGAQMFTVRVRDYPRLSMVASQKPWMNHTCGLSANLQVLRLASTAGSLHKHISPAPGGFVSNIWIVCKRCRGAVLWRAL